MRDVTCLGELFIDLVPHSQVNGQWTYVPSPGGAPGNVAVGLARLGRKALMLSRVGDEAFGRLLVSALESYGVDASGVVPSPAEKTGLSVVTLGEDGDRSFMFYHDRPADLNISPEDIAEESISQSRVLHVGVLPLSAARSGAAQRRAVELAHQAGVPVSCDLNFRPNLWDDPSEMIRQGRYLVSQCTIVKLSEEELEALCPGRPMDDAVKSLWHEGMKILSVTRGSKGAVVYTGQGKYVCSGLSVDAVDTTGAGDAYAAALLSGVLREDFDMTAQDDMRDLVRKACAAGACAAMRKGAMESLPTGAEIEALLGKQECSVSFVAPTRD